MGLTSFSRYAYGGAHAAWMVSGFPSYCTGSLTMITSSITNGICSRIGLRHFLQTHPHRQPNLVRLRYVPSSSYRFLQTPPLASDALANRILFPVNRVRAVTSTDWVCQLRWANKKSPGSSEPDDSHQENISLYLPADYSINNTWTVRAISSNAAINSALLFACKCCPPVMSATCFINASFAPLLNVMVWTIIPKFLAC